LKAIEKKNKMELVGQPVKCFEGTVNQYRHNSSTLSCPMTFTVFLPKDSKNCPVLYWLSGLTCNDQNFITKAGAQKYAAEHGLVLVCPDTSPRGDNVPTGAPGEWDFGQGAGFYISATKSPFDVNYHMYEYVTEELLQLVENNLPVKKGTRGIFGHSMGGHGALICALKNPEKYKSVSAFAPICNPINCAWGTKAFKGYLGDDSSQWVHWDSVELAKAYNSQEKLHILIDQGDADKFLKENQLLPENFSNAITNRSDKNLSVEYRLQPGYDHGYYFIGTFIEDHIRHHKKILDQ